ncbi:DUF1501 domain-containing protein [Neptunicella sp. SCSIO 80796]|uniref:DUF1501 domain-containing protein n=1 Tax=Neptunicella plasticusilytica TaxID=3117012 RepID=UPI003A4DBEA5
MQRRDFIKALGAGLVVFSPPMLALGAEITHSKAATAKIVWVVLRGAMDGLHALVPVSDPDLNVHRPKLVGGIKSGLLPLNNDFALHPSLVNLHSWYLDKQLLPVVAVSSGYQQRSHFDGQDYLESGLPEINHDSGWLARAVEIRHKQALAIARSTPISLRDDNTNKAQVSTWYPSGLKSADEDLYQSLIKMYERDPLLSSRLADGLETGQMAGMNVNAEKRKGKFTDLTRSCAQLMSGDIDCAMLELGGWDTHNNQHARLARQLSELDNGLAILKQGLGKSWNNTVVVVATEFGRTVKENGTGGTDHGTGSMLLLAGGAVQGGRVMGQWPGLANEQLFEQRDLMPTSNSFSWIGKVLSEHWGFSDQELSRVFPDRPLIADKLLKS